MERFANGVSAEKCFDDIRTRWDEKEGYDWCHTISKAEIVAASLLYGNGNENFGIYPGVSERKE